MTLITSESNLDHLIYEKGSFGCYNNRKKEYYSTKAN